MGLAAAAAIGLATLILGGGVLALVDRGLRGDVDQGLRTRAAEISAIAQSTPTLLTAPGALDSAVGGRALLVEIVDARGRLRARSLALGGRVLPVDDLIASALTASQPRLADRRLGGRSIRVYVAPLSLPAAGAARGAVVVAADVSDIGESLDRTRTVTLLSGLVAALVALAAAFLATRRAMRPLSELSHAAEAIVPTGDPHMRLPDPGTGDEVERLAGTLNRMLAAIEQGGERERRIVADASHELRTPLTALRGNAAFALAHPGDSGPLEDIASDVERLARTIEDLLALAREDAGSPPQAIVRLDELVRALAGELGLDLGRCDPAAVRGDASALQRALRNLVENAIVHGPPGEPVTLSLARRDARALVSVEDRGPGLVGEAANHGFERFWRGPESATRPGSGLGLAIVRATAERHGGTVTARAGRITIELPVAQAELSHGSQSQAR